MTKLSTKSRYIIGTLYNPALSGVSLYADIRLNIYVNLKFRLDFSGAEIYNNNWKETEACRSRMAGAAKNKAGLFITERRATS